MNSTKLLLLLCFVVLLSFGSSAQLGGTHNYLDTAYIAPRNISQQNDFLNNNHNFPAKPRDMWQLGIFVGLPWVDGDAPLAVKGSGSGFSNFASGLGFLALVGYFLSISF